MINQNFLPCLGFTQENPELLKAAIRQLADSTEAIQDRDNEYGFFYRVAGELIGFNGRNLAVITVWLQRAVHQNAQNVYVCVLSLKGVENLCRIL